MNMPRKRQGCRAETRSPPGVSRGRRVLQTPAADRFAQRGQSLVEACLAIFLIGLIFAGMFQIALLVASKGVLHHTAARAARAKTVGFNQWMVKKAALIGSIPIAGKMTEPGFQNVDQPLRDAIATLKPGDLFIWTLRVAPSSQQYLLERARIPEFLWCRDWSTARYVLNYEDWDTVDVAISSLAPIFPDIPASLSVHAHQDVRLWVPMHRAFYNADHVAMKGECEIENHYPLYLDDMSW